MIQSIFFDPWIWIGFLLIAIFIAVAVVCFLQIRKYDDFDMKMGWGIGGAVSLIVGLILSGTHFGISLVPYDASYYQTYRITGELTDVESAFSGDEGTMSQVFVASVAGIDEFIKSDDQRFRTLSAGDDVTLVCSKEFRYWQEPWYDCNFAS